MLNIAGWAYPTYGRLVSYHLFFLELLTVKRVLYPTNRKTDSTFFQRETLFVFTNLLEFSTGRHIWAQKGLRVRDGSAIPR